MGIFERHCRAMGRKRHHLAVGCGVAVATLLSAFATPAPANQFVRMDFNLFNGSRARVTVFIETFDDRPITSNNFLTYVNNGAYDVTLMHRLARNFVLQGGGYEASGVYIPGPPFPYIFPVETDQDGNPNTENPMIVNEFNNSPMRSNVKGTLAMAKLSPPPQGPPNGGPNSATSEFFFNLSNNAGTPPNGLDYQNGGFTVFAQVVGDGMTLIDGYNGGLNTLFLNPDTNGNGIRDTMGQNIDSGPFGSVPVVGVSASNYIPLVLVNADQIDYLGAGLTTTIPEGGLAFSARNAFIDTGTAFTGTGELIVGAGRLLGVREGNVLGSRSLRNLGTLELGLRIGAVGVQSFRQDAGAHLEIEINGTTVDTHYDRLVVSGGALLGGDLDVSFVTYNPVAGNSFTILTAGLIAGNFDDINLPQLSAGLVWDIDQTATAITLSVAAADFNQDGVVNAADYVVWRRNNGTQAQFDLWRANYGNTRGGTFGGGGSDGGNGSQSAQGVPEPTSFLLLIAAATMLFAQRRYVGIRSGR